MTVGEITRELNLTPLTKGDPDAPVLGGCCCDLLSWVMAHGVHQGAWITVQIGFKLSDHSGEHSRGGGCSE